MGDFPAGFERADVRPEGSFIEQCPVCNQWIEPRRDGKTRKHAAPGAKVCSGSFGEDDREFMVVTPAYKDENGRTSYPTRSRVTGRRSAEIVAASSPKAVILRRK